MLIILSTHPIQYQVPLWRALAEDGSIPFEVWYMSDHGAKAGADMEFGKTFAWDIDMLSGYPHRFLEGAESTHPAKPWECRLSGDFINKLRESGATALWIQGWQVLGYWQAAFAARKACVHLWLRGESNGLARLPMWKSIIKKLVLGALFSRVDAFLSIGKANRQFYQDHGVEDSRLHDAPYCVDNERFAQQAEALRSTRDSLRAQLGVPDGAFCALFCGKFIEKKHPLDLVAAAKRLKAQVGQPVHLLFAGSGELGAALRKTCCVTYDAEGLNPVSAEAHNESPTASFLGFLNQTEVSRAYVAADCLVLPSDYGETWGLVVNEAMASGLPCIMSDRCGSAHDLGMIIPNRVLPFGDTVALAAAIRSISESPSAQRITGPHQLERFSFEQAVQTVKDLSASLSP